MWLLPAYVVASSPLCLNIVFGKHLLKHIFTESTSKKQGKRPTNHPVKSDGDEGKPNVWRQNSIIKMVVFNPLMLSFFP